MEKELFEIEVEKSFLRSKRILIKKEKEYAMGQDRLDQFYRIAIVNNVWATEALLGMAMKHVTSIADMSKDPKMYSLRKWREKVTDLRNYTFLLDALLIDLGVE